MENIKHYGLYYMLDMCEEEKLLDEIKETMKLLLEKQRDSGLKAEPCTMEFFIHLGHDGQSDKVSVALKWDAENPNVKAG